MPTMKKNPVYEPPASGSHIATLTRITDLGEQKTKYGSKPQVRLRFEVEEKDSTGKHKFVTQTFTNSLHEKSNFVKFFAEIGKPLPDSDINTDSLIGTRFTITLKQIRVDGKTKIRIESVGPLKHQETEISRADTDLKAYGLRRDLSRTARQNRGGAR
jgi:hypothetical protein